MGRYANVDLLIDELKKHNPGEEFEKYNWNTRMLVGFLDHCPKADVRENLRAEWIEEDGFQVCSNCGDEHCWDDYRASYCECCGAKMTDTREDKDVF